MKPSRRRLAALWIFILGSAAQAGPQQPADFSDQATEVTFDALAAGQSLSTQYLSLGLRFTNTQGRPLTIVAPESMANLKTQSPELAVSPGYVLPSQGTSTGLTPAAIVIDFSTGQDRVGLYFGGSAGLDATLAIYDAQGDLLDSVTVTAKDADVTNFIGLDYKPGTIRRLVLSQPQLPPLIDNLIFEPGAQTPGKPISVLQDRGLNQAARLAAMDQLLLNPSPAAVEALRTLATNEDEPDAYLRERAVLALEQLYAREALPDLRRLGRHAHRPLALAAYNATWTIREAFPPDDPPQLQLELLQSTLDPSDNRWKVLVAGKIVSGDSDLAIEANLAPAKGGIVPEKNLIFLKENTNYRYQGQLAAKASLPLEGEFWFERPPSGEARPYLIRLKVKRILSPRDGQTIGDFVTYEARLHLDSEKGVVATPDDDQASPVHEVTNVEQGGLY